MRPSLRGHSQAAVPGQRAPALLLQQRAQPDRIAVEDAIQGQLEGIRMRQQMDRPMAHEGSNDPPHWKGRQRVEMRSVIRIPWIGDDERAGRQIGGFDAHALVKVRIEVRGEARGKVGRVDGELRRNGQDMRQSEPLPVFERAVAAHAVAVSDSQGLGRGPDGGGSA